MKSPWQANGETIAALSALQQFYPKRRRFDPFRIDPSIALVTKPAACLSDRFRPILASALLPAPGKTTMIGEQQWGGVMIFRLPALASGLLWALGLVISGCATTPTAPTAADTQNIHSVAIISAIGDWFIIKHTGRTAFSNNETYLKPDWDVDAYIIEKAWELLGSGQKIEKIAYDRTALFPPQTPGPLYAGQLRAVLEQLPAADGTDAFIVVTQSEFPDPVAYTNQSIRGLGVYSVTGVEAVHTIYDISLIDAHSHKVLSTTTARIRKFEVMGDTGLPITKRIKPHRGGILGGAVTPTSPDAGEAKYPETADAFTDQNNRDLAQELKDLIDRSLTYTFNQMNLTRR